MLNFLELFYRGVEILEPREYRTDGIIMSPQFPLKKTLNYTQDQYPKFEEEKIPSITSLKYGAWADCYKACPERYTYSTINITFLHVDLGPRSFLDFYDENEKLVKSYVHFSSS